MPITVVTGNPKKAEEIAAMMHLQDFASAKLDIPEIQSLDIQEIVLAKARAAFEKLQIPVLVEDTSFAIEGLKGFPGPFVKFWFDQVGWDFTVAHLVPEGPARRVTISSCVAYAAADQVFAVTHQEFGTLVPKSDGEGWGFDYYFIPDGYEQTYAQLGFAKKNEISHRTHAFQKMRAALVKKGIL